jgi:hypothetical protein
MYPVTLDTLHGPAVVSDEITHVLEIVDQRAARVVTFPATCIASFASARVTTTRLRGTDNVLDPAGR